MIRRLPTRSRPVAIAAVTIATLSSSACGDDEAGEDSSEQESDVPAGDESAAIDSSPDDGVHLLASGATDTLELPIAYEVGQRAHASIEMDMDISADVMGETMDLGIGLEFLMTQEVTAAEAEQTTIEMTIDEVDVTDAPAGADAQVEAQFGQVLGEVLVLRYDANGKKVGATELKSGGELPAELAQSFDSTTSQVLYPTEAVGVGAEWTAIVPMTSEGIELDVETTYELTELTADEYVIQLTQAVPIDTEMEGTEASGNLTGTGEVRGSRTNPLEQHMTYEQDTSMSMGDDGDMTMAMTMEMFSE